MTKVSLKCPEKKKVMLILYVYCHSEQIPPDVSRSGPFCMHQLKNMFGTSRIAAPGSDRVVTQWPCLAKHINVIYKDQIFSVQVIGTNDESVPVSALKE